MKYIPVPVFAVFVFFLSGCISQEPAEVHLHSDECAYCKMVISDERFMSQAVSDKGKAYKFDSIECLAAFKVENEDKLDGAKFYLPNHRNPGEWVLLENANIYRSVEIHTPMGLGFFSIPKDEVVTRITENARKVSWQEVIEITKKEWKIEE